MTMKTTPTMAPKAPPTPQGASIYRSCPPAPAMTSQASAQATVSINHVVAHPFSALPTIPTDAVRMVPTSVANGLGTPLQPSSSSSVVFSAVPESGSLPLLTETDLQCLRQDLQDLQSSCSQVQLQQKPTPLHRQDPAAVGSGIQAPWAPYGLAAAQDVLKGGSSGMNGVESKEGPHGFTRPRPAPFQLKQEPLGTPQPANGGMVPPGGPLTYSALAPCPTSNGGGLGTLRQNGAENGYCPIFSGLRSYNHFSPGPVNMEEPFEAITWPYISE